MYYSVCPFAAGIQLTLEIQAQCGTTLREFKEKIASDDDIKSKIAAIREGVETFALKFPMPGHDDI